MSKYFLYYAGFDQKSGLEQIGLATSIDLVNWERPSPLPIIPVGSAGSWDALQTSNPCVLRRGDRFQMWYQGKSESGLAVCYAESHDGVSWTVKNSPLLVLKDTQGYRSGYHHPHVIFDEAHDRYRMWVVTYNQETSHFTYAESTDGISWTIIADDILAPQEPWEGERIFYPFVRSKEDHLELWYTGRSLGNTWMIGRAESDDGLHWRKDTKNPLLPKKLRSRAFRKAGDLFAPLGLSAFANTNGSASPCVFEKDDGLYVLVHDSGGRKRLSVGLYHSVDGGASWKVVRRNILSKGSGQWDAYFQADPFLLSL